MKLRYTIDCPKCGVIYRSKQYWYGNNDPEKTAVYIETKHIWPGVSLNIYSLLLITFFCIY